MRNTHRRPLLLAAALAALLANIAGLPARAQSPTPPSPRTARDYAPFPAQPAPPSPRAQAAAPNPVPQNPRLGVNFSNYFNAYDLTRRAGASADRITFDMSRIHFQIDKYDWAAYDLLVTNEQANNLQPLGTLVDPPEWAADKRFPKTVWWVPAGLDKPWDDPGNTWAQYVYQAALRYKTQIKMWEIWNEPDLNFWSGTPALYARMLKVSYQAVKAANPDATVVFGGLLWRTGEGKIKAAEFFKALQADPEGPANNYFFDVLGFHLYDGGTCNVNDDIIAQLRAEMKSYLPDHPIWVTETGIRAWPTPQPGFATLDEQGMFVIQNYAYALSKNTPRYFYWRANDADDLVQPWGLIQNDGAPKPAYTAYQVAAQYLPATFDWARRQWHNGNTVSRISFYNTPLGRVTVFWNISNAPQTYDFPAILPNALLIRHTGAVEAITAVNGAWQLSFPPAPNFTNIFRPGDCLVGSPPIILIEQDVTPPRSTGLSVSQVNQVGQLALAWTGADEAGGSGLWLYDLQMRVGGGGWQDVETLIENPSYTVNAVPGQVYEFRVRMRDHAGNAEPWETAAQSQIFVTGLAFRISLPLINR